MDSPVNPLVIDFPCMSPFKLMPGQFLHFHFLNRCDLVFHLVRLRAVPATYQSRYRKTHSVEDNVPPDLADTCKIKIIKCILLGGNNWGKFACRKHKSNEI